MTSRNSLRREEYRFELRPYEASFIPGMLEAALESKKEVRPWMAWLHDNYGQQDAELWVAHCLQVWDMQKEFEFAIFDREDGQFAGSCGLNDINRKDMVSNLGYWVRTSKTRLGAATQATLLLKSFGMSVLGFNRLEIIVADGNEASRGVVQKTQAIYEGIQRSRIRVADKIYDAHMYAFV